MPLHVSSVAPTIFLRKQAFERVSLNRATLDATLTLTVDEFRVEGELIAIGPIHDDVLFRALLDELEKKGLAYFDDFFELSGNWPDWLSVFAMATRPTAQATGSGTR
jgi:hypothetical protein